MVRIPKIGVEQKQTSFFKIILPGCSNKHMRIPPRFVREYIVNRLTKHAKLRLKRSSEYSWNIKVKRSGEDVYLKDGWVEFLRAARLGDKEFLVFTYTGKMHFSIKVFNKNGCERMDFPDISRHQNTTSCKNTKRPRERPRKSISAAGKNISKSKLDVLKEVKEEEEEYQEPGELLKSKSQYFTSKIHRLTQVYVRKPFYAENISSQNYDFVWLKNSEGTEWFKVTLSSYCDTAFMTKGWHAFADANQVKVGSLCRFQIQKENRIVVHILNN